MNHKKTLVDVTIDNSLGRLPSSEMKNWATTTLVGTGNITPLYDVKSSKTHAYAIITPQNQSGNFVSVTIDNDTKTFQYTQNMESGKVYSKSVATDVLLPVDFVTTYNLATKNTFATDHNPNHHTYFAGGKKAVSGQVMQPTDVLAGLATGVKINSKNYHLPTLQEWMSIVPPMNTTSNNPSSEMYAISGVDGTRTDRIYFDNENTIRTGLGETLQWGRISAGSYLMPSRKFYNEYYTSASYVTKVNNTVTKKMAYAIRLKNTNDEGTDGYGPYTCAYRYTYTYNDASCNNNPSLRVKVRYLGPSSSTTISNICNDTYWSDNNATYYELIFCATGYTGGATYDSNNNTTDTYPVSYPSVNSPEAGLYWASNISGPDSYYYMCFSRAYAAGNCQPGRRHDHFPVRLFFDLQ